MAVDGSRRSLFWPGHMALLLATQPGSEISACIEEALSLARRLWVPVGFLHNDRLVLAWPQSDRQALLDEWEAGRSSHVRPVYEADL